MPSEGKPPKDFVMSAGAALEKAQAEATHYRVQVVYEPDVEAVSIIAVGSDVDREYKAVYVMLRPEVARKFGEALIGMAAAKGH